MRDSGKLWKDKIGGVKEFVRKYSVSKGITIEKLDLPIIDESTVLKIFYKGSTGLNCKVKITDKNQNIIFESNKLYSTGSFLAVLDPDDDDKGDKAQEKGFIIFEYSKNQTQISRANKKDVVPCWSNEVVVTMNPYSELIENLKCDTVKNSEFSTKLSKIDNKLFDVYEFTLNEAMSLDERIILEKQKLKIRFKHDSADFTKDQHGTLMILAHYDFPFMSMKPKISSVNGSKLKFIKYGSVDVYEEELGTESSLTQMGNSISYTIPNTFYSKADSTLEAEFSMTDNFLSLFDESNSESDVCFPLSLMIEYIPPNTGANTVMEDDEEAVSRINLVIPPILKNIPINDYHNITLNVILDKSLIESYPNIDPSSSLSGTLISQMCVLEHSEGSQFDFYELNTGNMFEKTNTIFPIDYWVSEGYRSVFLQFPVTQAYEDSCYKLVCRKDPTIYQGLFYDVQVTSNIRTQYCFGKETKGKGFAGTE